MSHLRRGVLHFVLCCILVIVEAENVVETTKSAYNFILPCSRTDPQLNACIKNSFQHLRPYLVNGLTDLNVPSIDPMLIPYMGMENGNGPVRVKAAFTNITAIGASNYTITKIRADIPKLRIDMGLTLPRVEITGKYEVNGNVLLFPVRSRGDFWAAFSDVSAIGRIYGKEVSRDGADYMIIEKLLIDFKLQKSRFKVKDTVNHGNIIGEAMNQFLNNNANEIIDEMKPAAAVSIAKHFKGFLNSAFTKIPIDAWLKP
ncbi:protein takeout-like [Arctopsyche grandis]|uniref:protein takeout-like n=1 Tax=Arctopsyche grandis TaxID=121162 RepID=UPI00406D761D